MTTSVPALYRVEPSAPTSSAGRTSGEPSNKNQKISVLVLVKGQLSSADEFGAVVLRAMPLVARGSVGVWSLVGVDSTGLQLEAEHLDLPVADTAAALGLGGPEGLGIALQDGADHRAIR